MNALVLLVKIIFTISIQIFQKLADKHKYVMCSTCSIKLYSAFDFKSTCLYVEEKIASYINPLISFVDLREVYLKEHDNVIIKMEDAQKICRLCLQLAGEEFVSFHEIKLDEYIPEVVNSHSRILKLKYLY